MKKSEVINQLEGWKIQLGGESAYMLEVIDEMIENYTDGIITNRANYHKNQYMSLKDDHGTYAAATYHLAVFMVLVDIESFIIRDFDIHQHIKKEDQHE